MTGPADSVLDLYARHAAAWTRLRGEVLHEGVWLDRFSEHLPAGASVIDLGCGPGVPVARDLARRGFRVTGVDSAPMIALFREAVPGHPAIVADMRGLELPDAFDGVLAWNSFFHLSADWQRRMFPTFARLARPGAPLMFTSGTDAGVAMGELEGEPLHHASLETAEYHALLQANGFELLRHQISDPDCGGLTVWLARRLSGL